jgi:hypothetical protein
MLFRLEVVRSPREVQPHIVLHKRRIVEVGDARLFAPLQPARLDIKGGEQLIPRPTRIYPCKGVSSVHNVVNGQEVIGLDSMSKRGQDTAQAVRILTEKGNRAFQIIGKNSCGNQTAPSYWADTKFFNAPVRELLPKHPSKNLARVLDSIPLDLNAFHVTSRAVIPKGVRGVGAERRFDRPEDSPTDQGHVRPANDSP